jgi:hypothetical protein
MRYLTFILIAVVLTSCGKIPRLNLPANLASSEGFSEIEKETLTTYLKKLNEDLGTSIILEQANSGSSSPVTIKKVSEVQEGGNSSHACPLKEITSHSISGEKIAGRATLSSSGCSIEIASFVVDNSFLNLFQSVLWHEMAHCLGMAHESSPGELMSPTTLSFYSYDKNKLSHFFSLVHAAIGF